MLSYTKTKPKTIIIFCVAIVLILGIVWAGNSYYGSLKEKSHLIKEYSKVTLPNSLELQSVRWTSYNIDTSNYLAYRYSSKNPQQDLLQVQQALLTAGYKVNKKKYINDGYIAVDGANNIKVSFGPSGDSSEPDIINVDVFSASANTGEGP